MNKFTFSLSISVCPHAQRTHNLLFCEELGGPLPVQISWNKFHDGLSSTMALLLFTLRSFHWICSKLGVLWNAESNELSICTTTSAKSVSIATESGTASIDCWISDSGTTRPVVFALFFALSNTISLSHCTLTSAMRCDGNLKWMFVNIVWKKELCRNDESIHKQTCVECKISQITISHKYPASVRNIRPTLASSSRKYLSYSGKYLLIRSAETYAVHKQVPTTCSNPSFIQHFS